MASMPPRRLLAALLLVLVACGGPTSPESARVQGTPRATPTPAPTPAPTPTPVPDVSDGVRFAAVGDIGQGNAVERRVGDRIAAIHRDDPLDALLLLGDLVYPDGAGERWESRFGEPWRAVLDAEVPLRAALGNHDVQTRDGADMMERFSMPGRYYSFREGPVAFFALDSNRLDDEQLEWLDAELDATDAPWRVLFLHEPPYSSSPYHGSSLRARRALEPLIKRHDVQLVLAAHDHNYERTRPIDGTVYVVAGTGCCLREEGRSDDTAYAASVPGVAVFEADPSRMVMRFVADDGRVLDAAPVSHEADAPAA